MKVPQEIITQLSQEKICILGLAREGLSTYRLLRKILPDQQLTIADLAQLDALDVTTQQLLQQDQALSLKLGADYLNNLDQFSLIFKTPGIPLQTPAVQQTIQAGVRLSSNLQLFFEILEQFKVNQLEENQQQAKVQIDFNQYSSELTAPIIIGVTGTKGKSTTSALIEHVLTTNNQPAVLVGNIGKPALDYLDQITSKSKVVVESSSHQLDQLTKSPDIAVIHAVTSEHLDYFANLAAYLRSKEAITKYQKVNQYVIYNQQFTNTVKIAQLSPGIKLNFQLKPPTDHDKNDVLVYIKSHYLTLNHSQQEQPVLAVNEVPLLGEHNLLNIMPAVIIGAMFGLQPAQIAQAIRSFQPLPHRLEKVATVNGINYINDSMATMPDAAISSLSCFAEQPIILLAGGHERNQDFKPFAQKIVHSKVKALALFPANGERLWKEIQIALAKNNNKKEITHRKKIAHRVVNSMTEAMEFAQQHAQAGDVVLLAPGAASFGVFQDYADRGEKFRKAVEQIKNEQIKK